MNQTNDMLRDLYLKDLLAKDFYADKWHARVRNIEHWKAIKDTGTFGGTDKGNVFTWSDTHFGHKNIIRYSNRPFPDVPAMNNSMIANYKTKVTADDTVIFGGDISFMSVELTNEILHELPGYKILIVGNHDMDRQGNIAKYHFDEVRLCLTLDAVDTDLQLLFTHYPLYSVPPGCVNVHGHIHDKTANAWNVNVSVEHTDYAPISLQEVSTRAKQQLA